MLNEIIGEIKQGHRLHSDVDTVREAVETELRGSTNTQMATLLMRVVDAVVCPIDEANKRREYKRSGSRWSTPEVDGEYIEMHPMYNTNSDFPLGKGTYLTLFKRGKERTALTIKAPYKEKDSFDLCDIVNSFPRGGFLTIHSLGPDGHVETPQPPVELETVRDMIVLLLRGVNMPHSSSDKFVDFCLL